MNIISPFLKNKNIFFLLSCQEQMLSSNDNSMQTDTKINIHFSEADMQIILLNIIILLDLFTSVFVIPKMVAMIMNKYSELRTCIQTYKFIMIFICLTCKIISSRNYRGHILIPSIVCWMRSKNQKHLPYAQYLRPFQHTANHHKSMNTFYNKHICSADNFQENMQCFHLPVAKG